MSEIFPDAIDGQRRRRFVRLTADKDFFIRMDELAEKNARSAAVLLQLMQPIAELNPDAIDGQRRRRFVRLTADKDFFIRMDESAKKNAESLAALLQPMQPIAELNPEDHIGS